MAEFKAQALLKEFGEPFLVLHLVGTTAFNTVLITSLTKPGCSGKDFSTYPFNARYLTNAETQVMETLEMRISLHICAAEKRFERTNLTFHYLFLIILPLFKKTLNLRCLSIIKRLTGLDPGPSQQPHFN